MMTDWNDADSLEDFEEQGGDLPVLDHLVPAEERADTDVERPAGVPNRRSDGIVYAW